MSGAGNSNRILNVKDVAELLQMSVGTIYHLVSQRRIPYFKLSARCLRFKSEDLAIWINELPGNGGKRHG